MTGATAAGGAGVRRAGAAEGRHRSTRAELLRRIGPCLDGAGFYVEDVTVRRAGSRSVVQVVIDRDGGVDLDAVAEASRLICAELDTEAGTEAGPIGPYVLEVSSPGVDRPLTLPRHWRRATGRLVLVHTRDGRRILGRVRDASEDAVELVPRAVPAAGGRRPGAAGDVVRVPYSEITRALVQVEFGSDTDTDEEMGS
jgi:ribosome maturation factor RimP